MELDEYQARRDFARTPEPAPAPARPHTKPIFVVQEHHASRLHYDFRLEADGVLKSWAVPRGPSLDPSQKRLAVRVEDHPLAYAKFKGTIPEGQYGAGEVFLWDQGTYENLLEAGQSVTDGIAAGRLEFALHGKKLNGRFSLVRMKGKQRGGKDNWLLFKRTDEFARPEAGGKDPPPPRAPAPKPKAPPPGQLSFTHTDKVLFPDLGITKADVLNFYTRIAPRLLPHLRDRPVTLERLPEGLGEGKPHFWQKNTPAQYPPWVRRVEVPSEAGKPVSYALVDDLETLLYLVNQGALTFHVWSSRVGSLDTPDFVLFDLDPGPAPFADVVAVARALHELLGAEGAEAFVKTSGKSGLHVLVAWRGAGGYAEARDWARGIAERLASDMPDKATAEVRKAKRGGKVYVDTLQNARGHHAVPPYVLRAVPQATVSTPLRWRELTPALDPASFNLRTIFRRLARQKADPMAGLA
jgi:bifunctional non-homologous end joining protein LigD